MMPRQPRILIVNMRVPGGDGPSPQYTGEWRDGYELAVALAQAGAAVTLLSPSIGKHEQRVRADIDGFAQAAGVELRYAGFVLNRRVGHYMAVRLSLAWLAAYLRFRPDLVIFKQQRLDPGLLFPRLARKALGLACHHSEHGPGTQGQPEQTALIYQAPGWGAKVADRLCRYIFAALGRLAPAERQYRWQGFLADNAVDASSGEIMLPKGILDYGEHLTSAGGLDIPADAVFCGAITENKGVFELVEAWKKFAGTARLVIIGAGAPDMERRLQDMISDMPNVSYPGAVSFFEKFRIMKQAKLFVHPSKSDYYPSAIFEALAMGLPLVVSRQIISPLKDGENGVAVDAHSPEDIGRAVAALLADGERRRRMAAAALETAARFSWDQTVARILQLASDPEYAEIAYPRNLCLSISATCQARCIYCPEERGRQIVPKLMPFSLFCRILEAARGDGFTGTFVIGENGEPLLHPDFPRMIAHLRQMFPANRVLLFTNMERMDAEMSRAVLAAGIDDMHFNFDGASAETYTFVKGLDFTTVRDNIQRFLELRNGERRRTKVFLQVISAHRYLDATGSAECARFKDDTDEVIRLWKSLLRKEDSISATPILRWAVKKRTPKTAPCGMMGRIRQSMYIAPSGDAYICCLDYNAAVVYGNLGTQTPAEVWHSVRRRAVLTSLILRRFKDLGPPCVTCLD